MRTILSIVSILLGTQAFANDASPKVGIYDGLVSCSGGPFGLGKTLQFPTSGNPTQSGYDFAIFSADYEKDGDKVKIIANGNMRAVIANLWLLTVMYTPKASAIPYENVGINQAESPLAEVKCNVNKTAFTELMSGWKD